MILILCQWKWFLSTMKKHARFTWLAKEKHAEYVGPCWRALGWVFVHCAMYVVFSVSTFKFQIKIWKSLTIEINTIFNVKSLNFSVYYISYGFWTSFFQILDTRAILDVTSQLFSYFNTVKVIACEYFTFIQ